MPSSVQPVVLHPAGDRRLVEQGGAVVAIDPQARRGLDDVDAKIEGDRGLGVGRDLGRETAEVERRRQALEVELDLGERQAIGDALQRQGAHQRAVGALRMVEAVGQAAAPPSARPMRTGCPSPAASGRAACRTQWPTRSGRSSEACAATGTPITTSSVPVSRPITTCSAVNSVEKSVAPLPAAVLRSAARSVASNDVV